MTKSVFPVVETVGLQGLIVRFSDSLSETANSAALAFRHAFEELHCVGVLETSTSLASVFLRFDPFVISHPDLCQRLQDLLKAQDWYQAPLPEGRKLWRVPTVYGTDLAPQLAEAADAAGMSETEAIDVLGRARVRVLTIGFAPGQPYLGTLGPEWDLPRQTRLTPMVPKGALVQAVRQFVLFSSATPTGWRHIGQTGLMLFRPNSDRPFPLRAGDEMQFEPVSKTDFLRLRDKDPEGGGTVATEIV